jgi:hypothetical protein
MDRGFFLYRGSYAISRIGAVMPSLDCELATKIHRLEEDRLNLQFLLEGDLPEEYRAIILKRLQSVREEVTRLAGTSGKS